MNQLAGQVTQLVDEGRLTPLAEVRPFAPLGQYVPRFTDPAKTGPAALDWRTDAFGDTNYNNIAYISVSRQYLGDAISYIRAHPSDYLSDVEQDAEMWTVPADEYEIPRSSIAGYSSVYDHLVLLQEASPGLYPGASDRVVTRTEVSWTEVAITGTAILLAPLAIIKRRRQGDSVAGFVVIWFTVSYGFLVTTLVSAGENMRFRFELGTLPVVAAVATIAILVPAFRKLGNDRLDL